MKWFKHYSSARHSNALTTIKAKFGFEGLGRYWTLMELMSEKFNSETDTEFVFVTKDLKGIMGYYHLNDLSIYLQSLSNLGLIFFQCDHDVTSISTRILLELQSRDFKRARTERGESAPKNKELRIKNKEQEKDIIAVVEKSTPATVDLKTLDEVLKIIPEKNKSRWLSLYDNDLEFIQRELTKAIGYYFDNPKKKPKSLRGWLTALSSWLERGWAYRAKSTPGITSKEQRRSENLKLLTNEGGDDVAG